MHSVVILALRAQSLWQEPLASRLPTHAVRYKLCISQFTNPIRTTRFQQCLSAIKCTAQAEIKFRCTGIYYIAMLHCRKPSPTYKLTGHGSISFNGFGQEASENAPVSIWKINCLSRSVTICRVRLFARADGLGVAGILLYIGLRKYTIHEVRMQLIRGKCQMLGRRYQRYGNCNLFEINTLT